MLRLALPLLQFHQYQGATNDCGPFTVAMVVNALTGAEVRGADVARAMNRPRLRGGIPVVRRIPGWATFPWGLADELERHHIPARWRFGATETHLRAALAEGRCALPIFGELRPLWAHVRLVAEYDPERGWGFVDAAHPQPEVVWDNPIRFAGWWRNYGNLLVETL
jgi:hypothetical protein